MVLIRRAPVTLLRFVFFTLVATCDPALAQYIYLDTNGDGVHSEAETINPSGPTSVDVWIRTDANRDGTQVSCSTPGESLTISGYEIILHAIDGTVDWGTYVNNHPTQASCYTEATDPTDFYSGFCGIATTTPGLRKLGTLTLTIATGTPSIYFSSSTPLHGSYMTAFGSQCPGSERDHTLKLGLDWFDADGARYGGWIGPPTLAQPSPMTAAEGSTEDQEITASDPDGSTLAFSKVSGPDYLTVSTKSTVPGSGLGVLHLAPGYFDAGKAEGIVRANDGVGSDFKSFGILITNVNRAPELDSIPAVWIEQGQTFFELLTATDPDGDLVSFSAVGLPAYGELSDLGYGTARLVLNPATDEPTGSSTFTVTASDGSLEESRTVVINIVSLGTFSGRRALAGLVAPNPLRRKGTLSFWTSRVGYLRVKVYDMQGRLIRTLVDEASVSPRNHRVDIDAGHPLSSAKISSGVYFYRIEAAEGVSNGKFLVTR